MKKTLMVLAMLLLSAVGLSAQSIVGKWQAATYEDDQRIDYIMTFSADNSMKMKVSVALNDPESVSFCLSTTMTGSYTKTGDQLKLNVNPASAKVKVENLKYNGELAAAVKANPQISSMMDSMIDEQVKGVKESFAQNVPFSEAMTIITLNARMLEIKSGTDGEVFTFTKVTK